MSFIAGAYTVEVDGADAGQARDLVVEHFVNKQLIVGDNFGSTPQDAVYQNMEVFIEFTAMEHDNVKVLDLFWPYDANDGNGGTIGVVDDSVDRVIKFTATAGTPAATSPATLTASRCILAEGFPVRIRYAPALREVPLRLRVYPDSSNQFYTLT